MKNLRFPLITLLTLVFACMLLFSCKKDNELEPAPDTEYVLQTSKEEYDKLISARTTDNGPIFELGAIEREGDILKINLTGPGELSDYKVVWNGILLLSYPAMTNLVIAYQPKHDPGNVPSTPHVITVNLKELFGAGTNPADVTVMVSNGSREVDKVVSPDGSVSNK